MPSNSVPETCVLPCERCRLPQSVAESRRLILGSGDLFVIVNRELIEWVSRRLQMASRQMQVNGRIFQACVTQQKLDRPKIRSGLQQLRRKAMAETVRPNPFA
jgi:hypothetical protein